MAAQGKGRAPVVGPRSTSGEQLLLPDRGGIKAILSRAVNVEERVRRTSYDKLDIIHSDTGYRKLDMLWRELERRLRR
jgi:hypothetical protein